MNYNWIKVRTYLVPGIYLCNTPVRKWMDLNIYFLKEENEQNFPQNASLQKKKGCDSLAFLYKYTPIAQIWVIIAAAAAGGGGGGGGGGGAGAAAGALHEHHHQHQQQHQQKIKYKIFGPNCLLPGIFVCCVSYRAVCVMCVYRPTFIMNLLPWWYTIRN